MPAPPRIDVLPGPPVSFDNLFANKAFAPAQGHGTNAPHTGNVSELSTIDQYLAALGVGTIGIADFDTVSISNLHRQILYTPAEVGLKKVMVASTKLQQQNPLIKIIPLDIKITSENVVNIIKPFVVGIY